jgi:ABC-2 type transport system ATP-binding protein
MIEAQSLSRRYGATLAVDNVTFTINRGEIVGLLGPNGAGKTTIMRMLSGYLEPSGGSVHVGGRDLAAEPHRIQAELGYLPENLPVYPEMTVADYLEYAATLKGIPAANRYPELREALAATELASRALSPIGKLSRGLRQRVGVAQAILGSPALLILDEPANGLDPEQTVQMRRLVKRLARRATVILSTHIMQEVDALCDRVLILRQGRLALDQPLQDLRDSRTLRVCTDVAAESLPDLLGRVPQIAQVRQLEAQEGRQLFLLELHASADRDTAASHVASCVINAGCRLYQLQTESRELESVFREVSSHDG